MTEMTGLAYTARTHTHIHTAHRHTLLVGEIGNSIMQGDMIERTPALDATKGKKDRGKK